MERANGGTDLVIRGAVVDGRASTIRVREGVIDAVEPDGGGRAPGDAGAGGEPRTASPGEGVRVIDARGLHAFPAFRNGHTHVAMVLFRGYGDDMPLMEWLETRIWPAEKHLTEEDVYLGARLGILEMIRGGTTFFNEMYWHRAGIVRAVREMGVRALVGVTILDIGDDALLARQKEEIAGLVAERRAARGAGGGAAGRTAGRTDGETDTPEPGRPTLSLAPHSVYTVTPPVLEWIAGLARDEGLPVHIHLSETAHEVERCVAAHGCRPAELLERCGLVGPRLVAAHGQYLSDAELETLGAAGATIVTNPTANLKLATGGIFPYRRARRAGVRVCLGTDGAASNNDLDMIQEMKIAALVQKHAEGDATALPAPEALAMATVWGSQAFGLGSGTIEAGGVADLALVDFSGASTQPLHDPASALVYASNASKVHTTVCGGRVLMHAGVVEVCDEREVIREASEAVRRLIGRVG